MTTETETKPQAGSGAPPCWPPLAHLVSKKNYPPKEGDIALCGAKLMGLPLEGMAVQKTCETCLKISRRGE